MLATFLLSLFLILCMEQISQIKQPKPNIILNDTKATQASKKVYNAPSVGIVTVPKISTTPITDAVHLTKQIFPRIEYKITSKNKKRLNFENMSTLVIVGCGLMAGTKTIGKIFKGIIKSLFK